MIAFVDTSAFYSILDQADHNHQPAQRIWQKLIHANSTFVVTNYVVVETISLLQNRLGIAAVDGFRRDVVPVLRIEWITVDVHDRALELLLSVNRRQLSLVDCVSFTFCRGLGIQEVFAFDQHFAEQGFRLLL